MSKTVSLNLLVGRLINLSLASLKLKKLTSTHEEELFITYKSNYQK